MEERLWSNRSFRLLWGGTMAVRLGGQIGVIAITWMVLKATGSGTTIGMVLALYALGDMLFSPWVGVLLDRLPRKLLLNADNLLQVGVFIVLAFVGSFHHLPLTIVTGLVMVSGALSPLAYLGRMIVLPNIVLPGQWESANTMMQLNMNMVTLLGPALGGVLVAALGIRLTLLVTAVCYGVYFVTLALMPSEGFQHGHGVNSTGSIWQDVLVGWHFLRRTPILLLLVAITLLFSLTYGPLEPALPILVHRVFHGGASMLGLMWSCFAIGSVIGTLAWGRWRPAWSLRWLVAAIIILWGLFSGALGLVRGPVMAGVLLALGGLSFAPYNILFSIWRQRLVPDPLRGRVFGAINGMTGVGLPLGQALGGLLIGLVGARHTVEVGGLACVILGVIAYGKATWWVMPESVETAQVAGHAR